MEFFLRFVSYRVSFFYRIFPLDPPLLSSFLSLHESSGFPPRTRAVIPMALVLTSPSPFPLSFLGSVPITFFKQTLRVSLTALLCERFSLENDDAALAFSHPWDLQAMTLPPAKQNI